ncbi:MAG TPA: YCF48-related protein [Candidatus Acidoferrum sp.]|nr:YCF48-related protein [Candidatus Acidoferrum sp.]
MLCTLFSRTLARVKITIFLTCLVAASAFGQWNPQKSNTTASLFGLSIVNANVVWASGSGGTFVRTTDGGETWQAGTVPGGEKLDFRDVYAVDAKTAYLMSIGNGNEARIYKTTDTGKTWSLQYTEQNPKAAPGMRRAA